MKLLETERLYFKSLEPKDQSYFTELLSDPKIIAPIPQPKFTEEQIAAKFQENLNLEVSDLQKERTLFGIFEKVNSEMIGLCLFLTNDEKERELGYRFRVPYWGKGYGTETAKGMINYYFNTLQVNKVTADVNTENTGSVTILKKFMNPVKEFFNERDQCTDRRYEIEKKDWRY